jgi:hypothetical protein
MGQTAIQRQSAKTTLELRELLALNISRSQPAKLSELGQGELQ